MSYQFCSYTFGNTLLVHIKTRSILHLLFQDAYGAVYELFLKPKNMGFWYG